MKPMEMAMAMALGMQTPAASLLSTSLPRVSTISPSSLSQNLSKSSSYANFTACRQSYSNILPPAAATPATAPPMEGLSRRDAVMGMVAGSLAVDMAHPVIARADMDDDYKRETQEVIEQVKKTLTLEKGDPSKPEAVALLRQASNDWVAKYRREKKMAGKTSFSNMYSALNAISGHYISFGPVSAIPPKRQQRILEEVTDAEKALIRGR